MFLKSDLYEYQIFDTIQIGQVNNILHSSKGYNPIYVLTPTSENVKLLTNQIEQEIFKKLHIYFVNNVQNDGIESLAKADVTKNSVECVKEIYMLFEAIDEGLFTIPKSKEFQSCIVHNKVKARDQKKFGKKLEDSLFTFFLSQRSIPTIYYKKSSSMCKKLGEKLGIFLEREYSQNHSEFCSKSPMNLVIIDRSEDPVTPLIHTWTYQAMIHEFFELDSNIVQQTIDNDEKIFLDSNLDSFYNENKFKNFGEFADSLSKLLASSSETRKAMSETKTINDLQSALDNLPSVQQESKLVSKHSRIINKLITYTKTFNLYDISLLQQEIVTCSSLNIVTKGKLYKELLGMILNKEIHDTEKLKLVMLWSLRNEEDIEKINNLKELLNQHTNLTYCTKSIDKLLNYYGQFSRVLDLFGDNNYSLTSMGSNLLKKFTDEPNVYERYKPKVIEVVDNLLKKKFKNTQFESIQPFGSIDANENLGLATTKIVIFILGGATYHEYRELSLYARNLNKVNVYLGSDRLLNSSQFLALLKNDKIDENFTTDFGENEGLIKKIN